MDNQIHTTWLDYANSGIGVLLLGGLGHVVVILLDMKRKVNVMWKWFQEHTETIIK